MGEGKGINGSNGGRGGQLGERRAINWRREKREMDGRGWISSVHRGRQVEPSNTTNSNLLRSRKANHFSRRIWFSTLLWLGLWLGIQKIDPSQKSTGPPMTICCDYSCAPSKHNLDLFAPSEPQQRGEPGPAAPNEYLNSSCLDHVPRQPRAAALLPIRSWTVGFSAASLPDFLAGGASELQGLGS